MAGNLHVDNKGIITFWDSGAREIFGYEEKEILGKEVFTLIPEDLAEEAKKAIKEAKEKGICENYKTERLIKGGKRIKVLATLRALKDRDGSLCGISIEVRKRD